MLLKSCLLLLFTLWVFPCLTIPKNQTILAVKNAKNRITLQYKNYTIKHKETLIGKATFTDNINSTGYVSKDFLDSERTECIGFIMVCIFSIFIFFCE